jgi:hypothetical protein
VSDWPDGLAFELAGLARSSVIITSGVPTVFNGGLDCLGLSKQDDSAGLELDFERAEESQPFQFAQSLNSALHRLTPVHAIRSRSAISKILVLLDHSDPR